MTGFSNSHIELSDRHMDQIKLISDRHLDLITLISVSHVNDITMYQSIMSMMSYHQVDQVREVGLLSCWSV